MSVNKKRKNKYVSLTKGGDSDAAIDHYSWIVPVEVMEDCNSSQNSGNTGQGLFFEKGNKEPP
jgi:hypothetical protein